MNKAILIFGWLFLWQSDLIAQESDLSQITWLLNRQVECWNRADLECFMEAYWKSDSVKYIGSNGVTYGWGNTLKRYRENYPDANAMGKLDLKIVSAESVGPDGYYMVGRYYLARKDIAEASGYFSLLWRRINGKWRIVSDHSS